MRSLIALMLVLVSFSADARKWLAEGLTVAAAGQTFTIPDDISSVSVVVSPTVGSTVVCAYAIDPAVDPTVPCVAWTPGTISATDSSFWIAPIHAIKVDPVGVSDAAKVWIIGQ